MEILDKDDNSQIDGKTISHVFVLPGGEDIAVVFTDKTYFFIRGSQYPDGGPYPNYLDRNVQIKYSYFEEWPNNVQPWLEKYVSNLIKSGLYTVEEIKEIAQETRKYRKEVLIQQIGDYKRFAAELEQKLSKLNDK